MLIKICVEITRSNFGICFSAPAYLRYVSEYFWTARWYQSICMLALWFYSFFAHYAANTSISMVKKIKNLTIPKKRMLPCSPIPEKMKYLISSPSPLGRDLPLPLPLPFLSNKPYHALIPWVRVVPVAILMTSDQKPMINSQLYEEYSLAVN